MGMDISTNSGIVTDLDTMLSFIDDNLQQVKEICQKAYTDCQQELEGKSEDHWKRQTLAFLEPLSTLQDKTADEVKTILVNLIVIEGEGYDQYILCSSELLDIWQQIVRSYDPTLPELTEIGFWPQGKAQGDIPNDEVVFVFDKANCYDIKLSKTGQKLKKIIGHCDTSEWSVLLF